MWLQIRHLEYFIVPNGRHLIFSDIGNCATMSTFCSLILFSEHGNPWQNRSKWVFLHKFLIFRSMPYLRRCYYSWICHTSNMSESPRNMLRLNSRLKKDLRKLKTQKLRTDLSFKDILWNDCCIAFCFYCVDKAESNN